MVPRPRRSNAAGKLDSSRCRLLLLGAAGVAAAAVLCGPWGTAHSSWRQAEDVLTEQALHRFNEELPHKWHKATDKVLRPLAKTLPDLRATLHVAAARRDFAAAGSGLVLVPDAGNKADRVHRKWRAWLQEVCRVLGFLVPDGREARVASQQDGASQGNWTIECPEFWVDEAWPPSPHTPRSKFSQPVWSVLGPRHAGKRGLIVAQSHVLKDFSPKEVKALFGFQLGKAAWTQFQIAWGTRLAQAYGAARVWHTYTGAHPGRLLTLPWRSRRRSPLASLANMPQISPAVAIEWTVLALILGRVPRVFQPIAFGGLLAKGGEVHSLLNTVIGTQLLGRRRGLGAFGTWAILLGETGALNWLAPTLQSTRSRAMTITCDRAAALGAGDAKAAAEVLLKVRGMLPPEATKDAVMERVLSSAATQKWDWRREAVATFAREPRVESRVRDLLTWAESPKGKELLALAHLRRTRQRHGFMMRLFRGRDSGAAQSVWRWWMGCAVLAVLFGLPLFTTIDWVRWASWSTISLSVAGVLLPFFKLRGVPGLPDLPAAVQVGVSVLLAMYSWFVWAIWWNHLLGGSRKWIRLSSQLTSELSEQADANAGLAYLARDGMEIARRSLSDQDQELCGSWRTSLHELAVKVTDFRQEFEDDSTPSRRKASSVKVEAQPSLSISNSGGHSGSLNTLIACAATRDYNMQRSSEHDRLAGGPGATLVQRVDAAIQNAARVESERMRSALDTSDPEKLHAMMTWWMARGDATASSSVVTMVASTRSRLCAPDADSANSTLGSLMSSQKLHQCFPYPSFITRAEEPKNKEETPEAGVEEYQRLEEALSKNCAMLQQLRRQLAPYEETKPLRRWTKADVFAVYTRFSRTVQWTVAGKGALSVDRPAALDPSTEGPQDTLADFRVMSSLFLAAVGGLLGTILAVSTLRCGSALAALCFGAANAVLLLNYQRLQLPHVARHYEMCMKDLAAQRDTVMHEARVLKKARDSAGILYTKARILKQSVNVIRNINYLLLCIKTEVQRVAQSDRRHIAEWGLRLLLAFMPQSASQSPGFALQVEDCKQLARMLQQSRCDQNQMRQHFADARKRITILFRMVHLSADTPCEVQGQLAALVEGYVRPVLVEQRVPYHPLAAERGEEDRLAPRKTGDRRPKKALTLDARDPRGDNGHSDQLGAAPERNHRPVALQGNRDDDSEEDERGSEASLGSFCAASSQSGASLHSFRSGADRLPTESTKSLVKMSATRGDVLRVLSRLPPAALQSRSTPGSQAENILNNIFSSVILVVQAEGLVSAADGSVAGGHASRGTQVIVATGVRFEGQRYLFERLQSCLLIEAAVPLEDAIQLNLVSETRQPGEVVTVLVSLGNLLEEEPGPIQIAAAWSALAASAPTRFNEYAMKKRRRSLRSAKDALRSLVSTARGGAARAV